MDEFRINAETAVCAVRLQFPEAIKQVQRRMNYRVRVPAGSEILLEVWRLSARVPLRDKPSATQKVAAQLVDLSLGGIGVVFIGVDGKPPRICTEDRLRIQITSEQTVLLIEGSMLSPRPGSDTNRIRTGVAFKTMDNDMEGRQNLAKLTRIVGELQRQEARRMHLGVA